MALVGSKNMSATSPPQPVWLAPTKCSALLDDSGSTATSMEMVPVPSVSTIQDPPSAIACTCKGAGSSNVEMTFKSGSVIVLGGHTNALPPLLVLPATLVAPPTPLLPALPATLSLPALLSLPATLLVDPPVPGAPPSPAPPHSQASQPLPSGRQACPPGQAPGPKQTCVAPGAHTSLVSPAAPGLEPLFREVQ